MQFILTILLSIPILISFYFSSDRDITWLFLSLSALVIILYSLNAITGSIKNKFTRRLLGFSLLLPLVFFELGRLVSFYFQGESFNERFFFHFNLESLIFAGSAYQSIIVITVIYIAFIAVLGWIWLARIQHNEKYPNAFQVVLFFFAIFFLEPDLSKYTSSQLNVLINKEESLSVDFIQWDELELNRKALLTEINSASAGKNLVFIYLESLEKIYTDEKIFPGLTPHINKLRLSGLTFTHMQQTKGTGWTVAGMIASQCGTPLLYDSGANGNDILQTGYLNQAACLGDILKQAGYYQVYLGGASTQFAGKGELLANHGYDEVLGKSELLGLLEDETYLSGWGLYDDTLFAIAEEKFKSLTQSAQPFNLTLLTLDTHHPDGHASRHCPKYNLIENTMLDAVHCTDFLLNQFLESLSQHPAWENTVVVLFSDHLAMRNVAQKYYPNDYERLLLFMVLNAETLGEIESYGTHMDVAPTILDLMGVQHEQEFLAGKNLTKTNKQLASTEISNSDQRLTAIKFINQHILTRTDNDLCSNDNLFDIQDNQISIGDYTFTMSLSGHQIHPETLGFSHGLLITFDNQGKVQPITFNLENLNHIIYQYDRVPFLLIARTDFLPNPLKTNIIQPDSIAVFLKNDQGKFFYLGSGHNIDQLKNLPLECPNRIPVTKHTEVAAISSYRLLDICQSSSVIKNHLDIETNTIQLNQIAYGNTWYQAILTKADNGQYRLSDLKLSGEITPNPGSDNCHAYYGNSELIIPALKVDKQIIAKKMKLVSDLDKQFSITAQENWE